MMVILPIMENDDNIVTIESWKEALARVILC